MPQPTVEEKQAERTLLSEEHRTQYDAIASRLLPKPREAKCSWCQDDPAERNEDGTCACTEYYADLRERLIAANLIYTGISKKIWICARCGLGQAIGLQGYYWHPASPREATGLRYCRGCIGHLCAQIAWGP